VTKKYLFSDAVKIIGLDFDQTILLQGKLVRPEIDDPRTRIIAPNGLWVEEETPNLPIIKLIQQLISHGKEVHIVTYRTHAWAEECYDFCKRYEINIKGVHATAGNSKIPFLEKIHANCHIDDDLNVCTSLLYTNIVPIIVVQREHNKRVIELLFKYTL